MRNRYVCVPVNLAPHAKTGAGTDGLVRAGSLITLTR